MANIHSTITYNANLSAAQAQIKALTTQIGALTAAFNTLDKSALTAQRSLAATFAAGVGQTGGFTTSTIKATSAVETFGRQLAANRLTMRQYFREAITGYTRENSLMRRLAEQQVRYQQSIAVPVGGGQAMMMTPQNINAASNAAALASQRFSVFNQLVNGGATAMLNWGKNTQWAGRQLMVGFTVPLMLFTAVASKQFRDLDKELTRFQKVYGSELGGSMSAATARMRDDVKELAYEISRTYGIAAKETAALAADIAATGQEGEQLMGAVQQTTRLAVLGEVDRQEAMKATLALQSAFRLNTNELAESINFLNAVENSTSATLQDLSTAIPKVGPVVRSLGGDIRDLAELLVAMREGGIPAAEAANALKSGLASLINPTKQASAVAKGFGVDLVGIVEANRGQLMPTIYAMKDALAGLDSFSRSRIIEQIFGKYQFARITALFDNIGRAGSQTQQVVELASKSSAELAAIANGEIRTLTESTAVKFQRTLEELKNSIMPIGEVLTETLIPIFEFIGKGVKMFTSFFQALPGPVKDFAKYSVAIAALAGPIIMLVGLFGNLFANGLKFGLMLTRIGVRIAGIKTEKFELLTADIMAAKLGVDRLTTSFDTQEKALLRLTGVLSSYEASLRRLTTANPALFVPGAIPGPRGQVPIRRQKGSTSPERVPGGYGGGDIIPALLEPGESVVTKEATAKYWPVISAMNKGQLPGFSVGAVFLGMARKYQDVQRAKELRGTLSRVNQEATTGRFASLPVSDMGKRVSSIGGKSSAIPGINGVYEQGGKQYVIKTHDSADSALAEIRGSQLTRDIFGLKTPIQELVKIKHPVTGDIVFAVRSPYDAKFASSTGVIDKDNFFNQSIASIMRRDKDLQPDNLYGNVVTDVGAAFVANKASQPRVIGGPLPSVQEQAEINFLMKKGGARKWFAEESAVLAKSMTEKEYVEGFKNAIAQASVKVRGAIDKLPYLDKTERQMYMRLVQDLKDAEKIDWAAVYRFHKDIAPEVKKPPTAAAIAKKEAAEVEKNRQTGDMAPWQYGLPLTFNKGGSVPGSGRGDKIPAMLEPGEFVVNRAATQKYAPVLMEMNRGTLPGFQKGTPEDEKWLQRYSAAVEGTGKGRASVRARRKDGEYVRSRPASVSKAFGNLSPGEARGHLIGSGGFMKNLRLDSQAIAWHPQLWKTILDSENQMANLFGLSSSLRGKLEAALKETGANAKTIDRIMTSLTGGIMIHTKDMNAYEKALEVLATKKGFSAETRAILDRTLLDARTTGLTGATTPDLRAAQRVQLQQYGAIERRLQADPGNEILLKARQKLATQIIALEEYFVKLGVSASEIPTKVLNSVKKYSKQASPSLEADRVGKNLSDGFIQGASKVDGRPAGKELGNEIVSGTRSVSGAMGPLGSLRAIGPGAESLGPATRIREAMHHEAAARSVVTKALQKEVIVQGMITDSQLRTDAIQKQGNITLANWIKSLETGLWVHKDGAVAGKKRTETLEALAKEEAHRLALEKKLSGIVTIRQRAEERAAETARIKASSDEALSRANVARAASSFGVGPSGSMGYFMGGVSPYSAVSEKSSRFGNMTLDERKQLAAARRESYLLQRGTAPTTGPSVAIGNAKDAAQSGMRGMNAMNAMFALSMVTSSISMMGGASSDAAAKLGLFTTALMTATMMMNMGLGKGTFTNFLGMKSLGGKMAGSAAAGRAAQMGGAMAAARGGQMGGAALLGAGRLLSVAGGPVGIAAGISITAAITGFMMYRNAAEEARQRAIAAFNDPVKSAEYFGETIMSVSDILEKNRLSNVSEDLQEIDKALREAVSQDYAPLIEQIKSLSAGAGAQELSIAYSNMIISGMSAENAKAAIEAIAAEAGLAGGKAFTEAVGQGLLDESLTIKDAVNNVVGQFSPAETQIGNSGLTILQTLEKERAALEEERRKILSGETRAEQNRIGPAGPTETPDGPGYVPIAPTSREEENRLKAIGDELDAIGNRIEDLLTVNPEMLSGVIDSLVMAYQQDPTAAIEGFEKLTEIINNLEDPDDRTAAIGRLSDYLRDTYGAEWETVLQTIDTAEETVVATQMAIAGISLDKAINDAGEFDIALGRAAVSAKSLADATKLLRIEAEESYFGMIDQFAQEQRDAANLRFENYSDAMDERIELYEGLKESAQDAFEVEQEGRQNSIEGMQEEMDVRRRDFDEQMQQLDDRREAIEKSSDAYIESLEKNQKAESFYAQQRKTAFGALEKLASGDVFGFLQEREQMSADAQEFSYDEMISGIEERRDLELEAIDEIREQKQKEQDEYEQMMEDRIKGVQDLMEIEQDAHDDRMEFYDKQIERANTARENALEDKDQEIEGIKTMEQDYRDNAKAAEERYSKDYAELKSKPYVEARKEMLRLRIEEIYYRGGVTLGEAVRQAGALAAPRGPKGVPMGVEAVLQDLGLRGDPTWMYNSENVGDTGVGDTAQQVRDMTVTADSVTINGDVGGTTKDTDGDGVTDDYDAAALDPNRAATGGYIQNGRVMLEGGGKVTGPGGPKSDVIPAYLSNGEYVIQASSVSKYGKDMMDNINAGKFAYGGYISADREEYQASQRPTYYGGTPTSITGYNKPPPTYFGGTPTSSTGYNKPKARRRDLINLESIGYNPEDPTGVKGLVNVLRTAGATIFDSFFAPFRVPARAFGIDTQDTTALGRFIGGQSYVESDALTRGLIAMGVFPFGARGGIPRADRARLSEAKDKLFRSGPGTKENTNRFTLRDDPNFVDIKDFPTKYPEGFAKEWSSWSTSERQSWMLQYGAPPMATADEVAWASRNQNPFFKPGERTAPNPFDNPPPPGFVPPRNSGPRYEPPPRRQPPPRREPPPRNEPPPRREPPPRPSRDQFTGPTLKTGAAANPTKAARISALLQKAFHPSTPKPEAELAYRKASEMAEKYGYNIPSFANGGFVRGFYAGGYVSADRAETAAAGNKYLGGVKVKPQYTGGTPMSATGYSGASQQAYGNVYGKKRLRREQNSPYTRGGYMQPGAGGGGRAGSGFNLMFQGIKNSIDQQGIFSTLGSMASSIAADPASLLPFYGLSSIDQSNQQGKDIASAAALMEILGVIPGVGIGFKGASLLGRSASRRAATSSVMQPLQSGLIPPKPIAISQITSDLRFSLGMGAPRILPPSSKPTAAVPSRDMLLLEWVKGMAVDENQLDNVFGTSVPNSQGGISPGGLVIGKDGVRRYVKGPYDSESGAKSVYLESLIANAYKALNMNVPDVNLLNIGAKERYFPGKNLTPELAAMGLNYFPPGELVTSSTMLDNVKHVSEFFGKNPNRDWADGLTFVESQLDSSMQSRLAREGGIGKAVDTLFGLRDSHIHNYVIKEDESIPLGVPGRLIPYRIDFGSNVFQTHDGRPIPNDPTDPLKILDPRHGSSFGFGKVTGSVYKQQVLRLEEMLGDAGGIGGLIDPIVAKFALQAPQHRLVNPKFLKFVLSERLKAMVEGVRGYANGGLVQKFADGGEALTLPNRGLRGKLSLINRNDPNAPANGGFLPGVGTTGVATAARPTTTTIGAQGGPNNWPHSGFQSATGKIPGTNMSLTMNKDVLPLFLAFASDYNRLIRPISYIGGLEGRDEPGKSNHPSGTAVDINAPDEGVYFGWSWVSDDEKRAVTDWWKGKRSPLAPWKSYSPEPYKTMNALMNKYKVLQWFGPTSLGGFITDHYGNADWMHTQISQSRSVSPSQVAQTIASLGINPDGTFNRPNTYAAGGFISGPGGPRSDMIPAMLSNGEYVVKASSVAKYGKGFMDQINSGSLNPFQGSSMQPRMFADGGMVGSAPMPAFSMPAMADTSVGVNNTNYAGNSSSTRNNTKVKVVINGAGGKGANAIANKVISMINSANNRRNHSRSI